MNYKKCCFTGHRPKGLPWGYNELKENCKEFKKVMKNIIEKAIINGYTYFITGMALGIYIICAELVLNLKEKYCTVMLECAIPCLNQEKKRAPKQQERYKKILNNADIIHYVSNESYSNICMNERNKYVVEQCDVVIAVWNGKPSGTKNTIEMAKSIGKKIRIINPFKPE